jgi:hypothetical protein
MREEINKTDTEFHCQQDHLITAELMLKSFVAGGLTKGFFINQWLPDCV